MKRLTIAIAALALATGVGGAVLFTPTAGLAHGPQQGSYWGGHGMGSGMMGRGHRGQQGWRDRDDCPYRDQSQRGWNRNMMGGGMTGGGMMGPGMMGGGMTGGGMTGGGMMGPGMTGGGMMGPGMMGWGPGVLRPLPEALSADDVRQMMERRLAWSRNPNLKVGTVEAKDDDTIEATIVTQDGSLVQTFKVDSRTGWMEPAVQ